MESNKVSEIITSKLPNISKTIGSFMSQEESKQIVEDKINNLDFFVLDNYYLQKDRIKNVELYQIAKEFSLDVFDKMNYDSKDYKKLQESIISFILSSLDENINEEKIKNFVNLHIDLKSSPYVANSALAIAIENFNDDYLVKYYKDKLSSAKSQYDSILLTKSTLKAKLLNKYFNVKINDAFLLDKYWIDMYSFNSQCENTYLYSNDSAKKDIINTRIRFLKLLGCKGLSYNALIKDAKNKGIDLSFEKIESIDKEYNDLVAKNTYQTFSRFTNFEELVKYFNDKNYLVNISQLINFLTDTGLVCAFNMNSIKDDKLANYVIYFNNEEVYTSTFTEICIHEMIHSIGGRNISEDKSGLCFNKEKRYINLEEGYVNLLAIKVAKEYKDKYGNIIPNAKNTDSQTSGYDSSIAYMSEVFKYYYPILNKIHLSDSITLKEANELMPYDEIANSVTKILDANIFEVADISAREEKKLKKLIKEREKSKRR